MSSTKFMFLPLALFCFSMAHSQVFTEQTEISNSLTGVHYGAVSWGDYDKDGNLDILLIGSSLTGSTTKIYRNNGDGSFTEFTSETIANVEHGNAIWGDYNNDGYLDIYLNGSSNGKIISTIYKNNGDGTFIELINLPLALAYRGGAAWGDYNNNGLLDLIISGYSEDGIPVTILYRNNGDDSFSEMSDVNFIGVANGDIVWGDYNNDGYNDIVISGNTQSDGEITKIYKNNGDGTFTLQAGISLPGLSYGSIEWGDYNNDGYLDLLMSGQSGGSIISKVYRNNGGLSFTENNSVFLEGVRYGESSWGDFNNDGFLDIILTGQSSTNRITKLYANNGDETFTEQTDINIIGLNNSSIAWGDYDNDNRLDIIISGLSGPELVTKVYKNNYNEANSPPDIITNLQATVNGNEVGFSWDSASDSNQSGGHSYNLYTYDVSSESYGSTVYSFDPNEEFNGKRLIVSYGNIQTTNPSLTLSSGNYNWSVQAIDAAFAGGIFAEEQSFIIEGNKVKPNNKQVLFPNENGVPLKVFETPEASSREWKFATSIDGTYQSFSPKETGIEYVPNFGIAGNYYITCESIINSKYFYSNPIEINVLRFKESPDIILTGVYSSSVAVGDYDNDGFVDILISGYSSSNPVSEVYRNNGDGTFTLNQGIYLTPVAASSVAWGDYNNSGYLDIFLSGAKGWPDNESVSKIFTNNGDGTFSELTGTNFPGVYYGSMAWGDYDNDGFIDLLLTGKSGVYPTEVPISKVYRNNGDGTFTEQTQIELAEVWYSSVAWGDLNNDAYLDIVLTGYTDFEKVTKIYMNNGDGTFSENSSAGLIGVINGSVALGDYNNDGFLDILLSGIADYPNIEVSKLYKNNGDGTFSEETNANLIEVVDGNLIWGDYDNDGYLDIILSGVSVEVVDGYAYGVNVTKFYRNMGDGSFSEEKVELPGVSNQGNRNLATADFNQDGKLDILITGNTDSGALAKVFYNYSPLSNVKPNVIDDLQTEIDERNVTFSWVEASDENQTGGHSYNLSIYRNYGFKNSHQGSVVQNNTTQSDRDLVAEIKNIQGGRSDNRVYYNLNGILDACMTYSWSVQAVDASFECGPFSEENIFSSDNSIPDEINPVPLNEMLDDLVGVCSVVVTDYPTAIDNCSGEIYATTSDPLEYFDQGTYSITWIYEDESGNTATQTQTIIVNDEELPVISCVETFTIDLSPGLTTFTVEGIELDPEASDNCSLQSLVNDFNGLNTLEGAEFTGGITYVEWTATDEAGNVATCLLEINVNLTTGLSENIENAFKIFPNPTKDLIYVDLGWEKVKMIQLTDLLGRVLFQKNVVEALETIDISNHLNGLYILRIETENKVYRSTIIKN